MITLLKKTLLILAFACVAFASQAEVLTWSKYNLHFEVPDEGFITYNTHSRLEMRWEDMVMTIQLYTKEQSTEKFLKENLQRKALGYSMYNLKQGKSKVKGFKGFNISGTMPDGSRGIIADLVSNRQNLIIEITVNYIYGNREAVEDMIKSFSDDPNWKPGKQKKKQQRVQSKQDAKKQKTTPKPQPKDEGPLYDA